MRYAFHPEARLEYREAAKFYEWRHPGLGAAFSREIEMLIARIVEAPDRWRFVEEECSQVCRPSVPYAIFYTVELDLFLFSLSRIAVESQATGGNDCNPETRSRAAN
jgi:hypothetical protein